MTTPSAPSVRPPLLYQEGTRPNPSPLELYLGGLLCSRCGLKVRLGSKFLPKEARNHHRWKAVAASIESPRGVIEPTTLHIDPVFRAFKLRLERRKVCRRFQLRIFFHNHHQTRQRGG